MSGLAAHAVKGASRALDIVKAPAGWRREL
jgi:hypothetical protein